MPTLQPPLKLLAALASAGVLAAGCGGGSAAKPAAGAADADLTAFAECMREHGVDIPDPTATSGGTATLELPDGLDPKQLDRAHEACASKMPELGDAQGDPAKAAELQDKMLRFAECMREHGVDMPDPKAGNGRVVIGPGSDADPADPTVRRAQDACRDLLPEPPSR